MFDHQRWPKPSFPPGRKILVRLNALGVTYTVESGTGLVEIIGLFGLNRSARQYSKGPWIMTAEVSDLTSVITVFHEADRGRHKFTSPQIVGLFIVVDEKDLETAYNELPSTLEELIRMETGRPVRVEAEEAYSEYAAHRQLRLYSVHQTASAA